MQELVIAGALLQVNYESFDCDLTQEFFINGFFK